MNKNKVFLLAAVTALTGGALVGVASFTKGSGSSLSKTTAGDAVPHEMVFTNENISEFYKEGKDALAELSFITPSGNEFTSKSIELVDNSSEGPSRGYSTDGYIFKINNSTWLDYLSFEDYIYMEFELFVDVENSVSGSFEVSYCYDDGVSESSTVTDTIDFTSTDDEGVLFSLYYCLYFENINYRYLTIDSITIDYSCTY